MMNQPNRWTQTANAAFALAFAPAILAAGIRIGWTLHFLFG